jgi:hypothetical protein
MKQANIRVTLFLAAILGFTLCVVQGEDGVRAQGAATSQNSRRAEPAARGGSTTSSASGSTVSATGSVSSPGTVVYMPSLRGTSFQTYTSYYIWNNYYSYLSTHFDLNPLYFNRFYRNTEPLITPAMVKLTLNEPIKLSSEILDSIDQLEEIIESGQAGTSTDKQALVEKSRYIRDLAKKIRRNQTLSYIDLREDKNLYSKDESSALSPEAMAELRGMATNLDHQLRNMYRQSSTSTVSVDSYREPSLESLTKGIEKLCKVIESQSKKL